MRIGLVMMLALVLTACGSKTNEGAAEKKRAATAAAQNLGDEDVAAVLESAGTPLAKVRFVLDSRPVAGTPFNVKLIVSAAASVPQLTVKVESADLAVDPASATLVLGETGDSGKDNQASQQFSVTARQEGLAELSVHLVTDTAMPETLYVIPVLVAKPGPAGAAAPASDKPDPAAAGDHGKPKKG